MVIEVELSFHKDIIILKIRAPIDAKWNLISKSTELYAEKDLSKFSK